MSNEEVIEYDNLALYFGDDFHVTDKIVIRQPTIQDIIDIGEKRFWSIANTFCSNPTSMRVDLWDIGIDWNDISDFELFIMLLNTLKIEDTKFMFGDLDFTQFKPINTDDGIVLIYMLDPEIQINEYVYLKMVGYLRNVFNIHPKTEKAKGKITKESIISEEKTNRNIAERTGKNKFTSVLLPLISFMLNHPGFKYKKSELRDVCIFEFMDSVKRIQNYESATSLMTGMYMGMVDLKNINIAKELNLARDLYE